MAPTTRLSKRKREEDISPSRCEPEVDSDHFSAGSGLDTALPHPVTTAIPSTHSSSPTERTIPSNCCYHCLTRGGYAAFECLKTDGQERCVRCIRDNISKCRIPTPEEAISIAARCPQCTRRGFKKCNGANPCDTCVRNKTQGLCRQYPKDQQKRSASTLHSDTVTFGSDVVAMATHSVLTVLVSESPRVSNDGLSDTQSPLRSPATLRETIFETRSRVPAADPDTTKRPRRSCAKASYAEIFEAFAAFSIPDIENEDVSDADSYDSMSTDENIVVCSEDDDSAAEDLPHKSENKQPRKETHKGLDRSLPPLSNIEDIFADMAARAMQLGLCKALEHIGHKQLKVATMCSGTESPLLALDLLSKALENAGSSSIRIDHQFSAEIQGFKQSYIERNFQPKVLFRDIRDFIPENATTAITAYGSEVEIPSELDILIAGFVCKDLSRLNNHNKNIDDDGESGDTWRALYAYVERFRPSIVLLENVKAQTSTWIDVVARWNRIDYEAAWIYCDTKNYYLPQTRERMYMIAINRKLYGKNVKTAVDGWGKNMRQLQRQCSSPYEAFLSSLAVEPTNHIRLRSEQDWALCKLRYDHIRSEDRLGILRPATRWSENRTIRPPDFANLKWYNAQSSRVYDAIDVAHLQAARKDYDSMYKMMVWDVSQNVDRFKGGSGIVPCISPDGCLFTTNRHTALSGQELLLLQGMPMNKLLLATETQKDCQDLAGNAMSTTVIGASLISAIICGWQSFRPGLRSNPVQSNYKVVSSKASPMTSHIIRPDQEKQLNLEELKHKAMITMCLCKCEGVLGMCKTSVLKCSACGHTSCKECAGNPKHHYTTANIQGGRSYTPMKFVQDWKPTLPVQLKFERFHILNMYNFMAETTASGVEDFVRQIVDADITSQYFCLRNITRQWGKWKAVYSSEQFRLELEIGSVIQWLLFVKCPADEPGNSPLRSILEGPVARATVETSLLDCKWQIFLPTTTNYQIRMTGSRDRNSSWRSRMGLPDYHDESVPKTIHIQSETTEALHLTGKYEHLPHCGTACGSLYRRTTIPKLFMFLDPDSTGQPDKDCFVFSHDHSRKNFGEQRITLARLDPSWRPWDLNTASDVNAILVGAWAYAPAKLKSVCLPLTVNVVDSPQFPTKVGNDCLKRFTILSFQIPENVPREEPGNLSWAIQQVKHITRFKTWQQLQSQMGCAQYCSCSPKYPEVQWFVDEKGIATPHENRQAASSFERAIKTRPSIFQFDCITNANARTSQIKVELNISTLIHRARSRLAQLEQPGKIKATWRLETDHAELPPLSLPPFHLRCSSDDAPILSAPKYLRGSQMQSLSWMVLQELGRAFTVTEIEEAVQADLGWRAEAQAEVSLTIRGGVLADLPSFGKTVTTIALIQHEFEQHSPKVLLRNNKAISKGLELPGRIDLPATLIVCPSHIASQWQTELKKFLQHETYNLYKMILIESFAQLKTLTIEEIQDSAVIILSWNVFAEEGYISQLAGFTAMPQPVTSSRRGFETWLNYALGEIPSQLDNRRALDSEDFRNMTEELLKERLQHDEFKMALPVKIQHGSAYRSFSSLQAAKNSAGNLKSKTKSSVSSTVRMETYAVPLMHLFRFNRIVIDEYHYLNDDKKTVNMLASVSVKQIAARKRWVLSGTPAMNNFTEVDDLASYLGVRLGRRVFANGVTTAFEKTQKENQTLVESFLSRTEILSRHWHKARHERAQEFLDVFARQNAPELQHITCFERLMTVDLSLDHQAVYLELSQHLISQKMQIKTLQNTSEKNKGLNASVKNSTSAASALLKLALCYETSAEKSGLHSLVLMRTEECRQIEKDLLLLISGFEGLRKKDKELQTLYNRFKKDIRTSNWLGDENTMQCIRGLLSAAEANPDYNAFPELKSLSEVHYKQHAKKLLSQLREYSRELAARGRSKRFIATIKDLASSHVSSKNDMVTCSSPQCKGYSNLAELYIISHCGHSACHACLSSRHDDEACVHTSCNLPVQSLNLIKASTLNFDDEPKVGRDFGKKLDTINHLIASLPHDDQAVVFAPDEETTAMLEQAFAHFSISYHSPGQCTSVLSAKMIEDFKANRDLKKRKKAIILNLGSESAAGINLTNANHVIFVSPLLASTQHEYDPAMAQAIARSRRYGQVKKVHIYHIVALHTIDVDILEHRHKRADVLSTTKSTLLKPKSEAIIREKTVLVRSNAGGMALVAASWLADEKKRRGLDMGESPKRFTSLIDFLHVLGNDGAC